MTASGTHHRGRDGGGARWTCAHAGRFAASRLRRNRPSGYARCPCLRGVHATLHAGEDQPLSGIAKRTALGNHAVPIWTFRMGTSYHLNLMNTTEEIMKRVTTGTGGRPTEEFMERVTTGPGGRPRFGRRRRRGFERGQRTRSTDAVYGRGIGRGLRIRPLSPTPSRTLDFGPGLRERIETGQ